MQGCNRAWHLHERPADRLSLTRLTYMVSRSLPEGRKPADKGWAGALRPEREEGRGKAAKGKGY